ncbi:radiation-inducible immediate-early gene IEX-1 [Onychostoma macrolepis]|uniref:radiation-inducible immediate-early gene IEX-1 n=1 Tax=Onychostoma macrolepis TaxID=369639 RepID=UPI00272BE31F|nr:radiation-inducible immediate-early gene IEX-1 [Onychostoma macrolepis]
MYTRSDSLVLSLPTNTFFQPQSQSQFDFRPMMPRNTEPEIFTFERIPETQQSAFPPRGAAARPRKRNTRVMYPSKVRKYLPPAEKSPAKRWLLVLCLVVFLQIYTEEGSVETTQSEGPTFTDVTSCNVLRFQSAEEQAREMMGSCSEDLSLMSHQQLQSSSEEKKENTWFLNTTCPSSSWEEDINTFYQQSRRNGYVVALLYPVYHRLGTEN